MTDTNEHSSLLQFEINYDREIFILQAIWDRCNKTFLSLFTRYRSKVLTLVKIYPLALHL
jgi:hypothetical protein